jgi:hypothetical protein
VLSWSLGGACAHQTATLCGGDGWAGGPAAVLSAMCSASPACSGAVLGASAVVVVVAEIGVVFLALALMAAVAFWLFNQSSERLGSETTTLPVSFSRGRKDARLPLKHA